MPKARKRLRRVEKLSFCPGCGKRFSNETNVLRHLNQPSVACGSLIRADSDTLVQEVDDARPRAVQSFRQSPPSTDARFDDLPDLSGDWEDFHMHSDLDNSSEAHPLPDSNSNPNFPTNVEYHPRVPQAFPGGKTFMSEFVSDQYGPERQRNLFYPFASREDWQLGSWLLRSGLSMAAIDGFLSLDLIKTLPISFRSARQLRLRTEMLPSGPRWKSLPLHPSVSTKRPVTLYHRDPIECLQALLSHPLFEHGISFVPRKVWSTAARAVRVYEDWLSGNHAWELQDLLPAGATLLGVTLSSDKTNISTISGNRMAHPLLISLANLDADIRSKGSLHAHLLLALLPVPSFVHKKSRVRGLLADRLFHYCLDIVLRPLKIAATIGVMMSDPVGNLRHCYTPLVAFIADTPEQSLVSGTSIKTSPISTATHNQFGDSFLHPPRTPDQTRSEIHAICSNCHPDDYVNFLKFAKSYGLNGVDVPFWVDWPLSSPARFLKPEPLHHFHRCFFDHDLKWCITVLGDVEIDYRFSLIRMPVGYRSFKEGVSKLKQVTGRDHRSMQRYIVGVIAGGVPPRFLTAIRALMDFRYIAQMPSFDEHTLDQLDVALQTFHGHKNSIIAAGARSEHFNIPKLELLQHVVPSIRDSGAAMQWSADVTEHAHVTEVKNPARAGNNQNYYSQIARHLDRADKCFRFDLATRIATTLRREQPGGCGDNDDEDEDEDGDGEEHEPDEETLSLSLYNSPKRKIIDYFQIATALANDISPATPLPLRTFASPTTAIHVGLKPSFSMNIIEASEYFKLPDLHDAINGCLDRCSNSEPHDITGQRPNVSRSILPTQKIQIWSKIRVQLRTWHDSESVEPPQTLIIAPPSQRYPSGRYDCSIISPTATSNWPAGGLNGHLVVQLRLVFRVLGINTFLAYVQRFNISPAIDAASGLHSLKRATRRDGSRVGDVVPLVHLRSPAQIIPRFGKTADARLSVHTSYELCTEFWLNKYWNKQFYYSLTQ